MKTIDEQIADLKRQKHNEQFDGIKFPLFLKDLSVHVKIISPDCAVRIYGDTIYKTDDPSSDILSFKTDSKYCYEITEEQFKEAMEKAFDNIREL